ncbi:MAG: serine hydrolase domain-containing protein [Marinicella sp.]
MGTSVDHEAERNDLLARATAAEVKALVAATTIAEVIRAFSAVTDLEKAFIDAAPTDIKDGLVMGKLGVDGGNKAMLVNLAEEIANEQYGVIDSLLIVHKGKLLFESYYRRGRINLPHPQASATKTYTGLVLGRAIQLGYLSMSDLDKPLVSFLKSLDPSKFIEDAEKITLRQALTMTTGIRISSENKEKMQKNPKALKGQGEVQAMFEHSDPITVESRKFAYSAGPQLVMQVIDAVVPGTAQEFIKNEFLNKMNISTYAWLTAESGLPVSGSRSLITSRDMVKLGTLAINKGRWQGEQLIPEAYMTQAISRINYAADDVKVFGGGKDTSDQGYGYFWWSTDLKNDNKSYFSSSAQGGGGQFIILIEELDLLIVTTGGERHPTILQMTAERILPAFTE